MIISDKKLTLEDIEKVVYKNEKIEISDETYDKIKTNNNFLKDSIKNQVIYGVNTGFGPMAQYKIEDKDLLSLQYNLIRSHSNSIGERIPDLYIKSIMLIRLKTLSLGFSGVSSDSLNILVDFINNDIYPVIYEHGSVGASGDLVQLAHIALAMIGEGEVSYKGDIRKTKDILEELGIKPLKLSGREGLALINGTSCMSGIGAINIILSKRLINWSIMASSILIEIAQTFDGHFSKELNSTKLHIGQRDIASMLRNILKDSKLTKKREGHTFSEDKKSVYREKVQAYYSIRCVPQILGPILDTIIYAENILTEEMNSVSDNPIIDDKNKQIYHGGNFHGDYISLEMDKIKIGITKQSILAERQLNYILNDSINGVLPPFVNLGTLGLNLGMQALQFPATSNVAENQTLSNPMYIHSIPSNKDNQDVVSMGTNSAMMAKRVIENSYEVLAIEFIGLIQSIDALDIDKQMSSKTNETYKQLRELVPKFIEDAPKYNEIRIVKEYLQKNDITPISSQPTDT